MGNFYTLCYEIILKPALRIILGVNDIPISFLYAETGIYPTKIRIMNNRKGI